MESPMMLLTPESSANIGRDMEGKGESPEASPPMEVGRRRGSNCRLPSLATLLHVTYEAQCA
ncbi:hypothetical protein pdam_00009115 [Pocillopora damicornis]|uniref:Uncharacterized protein n=2 Tax=Pocillopora TaxID=46730 RepID=A0A3M6U8D4_POCDA|nr:hypothetical protein pdam_00009115 [Pocillopora damicornis]CAH3041007.1 unnamed protein product [Pocillopora meandrina]